MAHYAFLDDNNIVVEVIVGIDETELIKGESPEVWYGNFKNMTCKRTSYNGNIRNKFASIGDYYHEELDIFFPPKPFESWIFDEETYTWKPPIEYPTDGKKYKWNESIVNWELVETEEI